VIVCAFIFELTQYFRSLFLRSRNIAFDQLALYVKEKEKSVIGCIDVQSRSTPPREGNQYGVTNKPRILRGLAGWYRSDAQVIRGERLCARSREREE
jgi:hypothetical protein